MTGAAVFAVVLAGKISVLEAALAGAAIGAVVGALGWLWKNRKGRK